MKIVKKNKTYFLNPEGNEENALSSFINKDLEIKLISKDVFAVVCKESSFSENNVVSKSSKSTEDPNKQKIINLLNDKNITSKDKVEGSFEKFLNFKDLKVFKEMLKNKEIIVFKLSEKYKKGIYQVNDSSQESSFDVISFFKQNDYVIIKSQKDINLFGDRYKTQIQSKEIIGLKSFDGFYYIITKELYEDLKSRFISLSLENDFSIDEVSDKLKVNKDISKILLEVLKEDCIIIEKRKGIFKVV